MYLEHKVVDFDPYSTGLEWIAKYFLTLMHDYEHPILPPPEQSIMKNDGIPALFRLFL